MKSKVDIVDFVGRYTPLKLNGQEWVGRCPFHDDETPSLSVNREKRVWHCFGCGAKGDVLTFLQKIEGISFPEALRRLAEDVGVTTQQPAGLQLNQYANDKCLPVEFLESVGVRQGAYGGQPAVCIPYRDEDGTEKSIRFRTSLSGDERFRWRRGDHVTLYGLERLPEARNAGYVVLVEGESDAQTLWFRGVPSLGVPGVSCWKPDWAKKLQGMAVYVWQEPDPGGAALVASVAASIPSARILIPPSGTKDPSDYHVVGGNVKELIANLIRAAVPAGQEQVCGPVRLLSGPELLAAVEAFVTKYVALPEGGPLTVAAWTLSTYVCDGFDAHPYLIVTSPEKRCGKTRLLEVLDSVCHRPERVAGISEAGLFRLIEAERPTLLIDEAQALSNRDERSAALHDLLCAGNRQGAVVIRVGGPRRDQIERFAVFTPKALAAIGGIADIIRDRGVEIRMSRLLRSKGVSRFIFQRVEQEAAVLRESLARWAQENQEQVRTEYLAVSPPEFLMDREEENWASLFAVVAVADREALPRLRDAAAVLTRTKSAGESPSVGLRLLADIRTVFDDASLAGLLGGQAGFLATKALLEGLVAIEEAGWDVYKRGRPLSARDLSTLLRSYDIRPKLTREGAIRSRGYQRADFEDAWSRYFPPETPQPEPPPGTRQEPSMPSPPHAPPAPTPSPGSQSVTPVTNQTGTGVEAPSRSVTKPSCHRYVSADQDRFVTDVTDKGTGGRVGRSGGSGQGPHTPGFLNKPPTIGHGAPRGEPVPETGGSPSLGGAADPPPFTPSCEWQDVLDGCACPPGGEYRMNLTTGRSQARWPHMADAGYPNTPTPPGGRCARVNRSMCPLMSDESAEARQDGEDRVLRGSRDDPSHICPGCGSPAFAVAADGRCEDCVKNDVPPF